MVEKRSLMVEASGRFEAATHALHQFVDTVQWAGADQITRVMAGPELEMSALRRFPTWPWEAGTLRNLTAALLLPIVIWLIQTGLSKWLGWPASRSASGCISGTLT